jgi:hypothetical protein
MSFSLATSCSHSKAPRRGTLTKRWTDRLSKTFREVSSDSDPQSSKGIPQDILRSLPEDSDIPRRLSDAFQAIDVFRSQLIRELEPIFRAFLQEHPPCDLETRRSTVYFLNKILRDNNLALVHPKSQTPCTLAVQTGKGTGDGRIILRSRKFGADKHRVPATPLDRVDPTNGLLMPLSLIVAPREEPFSKEARLNSGLDGPRQETR